MKIIFSKTNFPKAPGGNLYEWKGAETSFETPGDGKYAIAITASAKNALRNKSKDDDDLRVALNGYEFGKYETHDETVSWKGFGTASSWDGAVLLGGEKTIYFFIELQKGEHCLKFYADETPALKEINVFRLEDGETIEFKEMEPPRNVKVDKKGVPWLGFIFLGVKPKHFSVTAIVKSAAQKGSDDGDNLKILVNGRILQNIKAPASDKYKNFYFSGDLDQKKSAKLEIVPSSFEFLEDSVELWYDEKPKVTVKIEIFDSVRGWMEESLPEKGRELFCKSVLQWVVRYFRLKGYEFSGRFLEHSLSGNPHRLLFGGRSLLAEAVKKDQAYQKILSIIQAQIRAGIMNGQIMLGEKKQGLNVEFLDEDLSYSLHGLKKIEYETSKIEKGDYRIAMTLFDIYDFDAKNYQVSAIWIIVHMADILEEAQILRNFEIQINISEQIRI